MKRNKSQALPRYLSHEDADLLLNEAEQDPDQRVIVMIRLMMGAGLRISEVSKLDVRDLVLGEKKILVRDGKGGKDRPVWISPKTVQDLDRLIGSRISGPVFKGRRGGLSTRRIREIFQDLKARSGIRPDARVHDLRHTAAVRFIYDREMKLETVRRILGHSNIRTTQRYLLLTGKDLEDDINDKGGAYY